MKPLRAQLQKAIAAAATVTGRRFGVLVASSLLATSGIVASAMNSGGGLSPTAAVAAQSLLEEHPTAIAAAPTPTAAATASRAPSPSPSAPAPSPEAASPEAASPESFPASVPSTPEAAPASEPEAPPAPPAEPEGPEAGPVKHVFLISLASPGYDAAWGPTGSQMPYLSGELRRQGVLLTNYSLLSDKPLPNGIAAISGQTPTAATKEDCPSYEELIDGDGCVYPVETLTVADQFVGARLRWHGYFEGMADAESKPDDCVHPEPDAADSPTADGYAAKLNPFVFFHSLLDLGDCDENDVPQSELADDLTKADTTANFNYISPNLCNSGFLGQCPEGTAEGAAAADAYLAKVVPEILASPAYKKDGLLIVSFGAADPAPPADPAAAPPVDPLNVGALLVSPLLTPGGTDAVAYDPYSLLRSTEELFGLEPLGAAKGSKVRSFASAFIAPESAAGD